MKSFLKSLKISNKSNNPIFQAKENLKKNSGICQNIMIMT